MKTFRQFLAEAKENLAPASVDTEVCSKFRNIFSIASFDFHMWEKIYKDINKNKFKKESYFKDYDNQLKFIEDNIKKYPHGLSYSASEVDELKNDYERAKQNYIIDFTLFDTIKIGEKQETAVKKLSKALKDKNISKRFDSMSENEILYEIEKFNGQVKVRGGTDLYINFKDGKVVSKEF